MINSILGTQYVRVKQECAANWNGESASESILVFAEESLKYLVGQSEAVDLVSRVPGKQYFSFRRENVVARPVNKALFLTDPAAIGPLWEKWQKEIITPSEFASLSYTVALAPCLAMELFDRQNKKGPATYFECYIGHLFAKAVGVNPTKRVTLPVYGRNVLMTMDFLFDIGDQHPKVHVPVKMSTRERVVQAWAHQRMLDAAYGDGAYRGVMVLFSETKLDSRTLEVVEICVPDQWLAYQQLVAKMDRIYYFDVPCRYELLTQNYPEVIAVKPFGEFFTEREAVLHS